jgi:hypothetical protein
VNERQVFNGGWIDLGGLVYDLGGRPFQADVEEVFTPHTGGAIRRRSGRVLVDRCRRVRMDVQEDGGPAVMFCFDAESRTLVCGVVGHPETWVRSPSHVQLEPGPPAAEGAPVCQARRVEFSDADGSHVYRLFNERYEDPDERVFPEQ